MLVSQNDDFFQSLSHLLSTISNIVIGEEIGQEIHRSVEDFLVRLHLILNGKSQNLKPSILTNLCKQLSTS